MVESKIERLRTKSILHNRYMSVAKSEQIARVVRSRCLPRYCACANNGVLKSQRWFVLGLVEVQNNSASNV